MTAIIAGTRSNDGGPEPPAPPPEGNTLAARGPFVSLDPGAFALAVGNFLPDDEQREDIAVVYENSSDITFLRGDGQGHFLPGISTATQSGAIMAIAAVPPTNDIDPAALLVLTPQALERIEWTPAGGVPTREIIRIDAPPQLAADETRDLLVGDLDNDGMQEAVMSTSHGNRIEFFSLASDPLARRRIDSIDLGNRSPISVGVADYFPDGEKRKDLAVTVKVGQDEQEVQLHFQRDNGTWCDVADETISVVTGGGLLARGEFDLDANTLPDLALLRADGTSTVFVLRVNQAPSFLAPPVGCESQGDGISLDLDRRGGGHLSPAAGGLLLMHLPGGKPDTWDRVTIDAGLGAIIASYFAPGGLEIERTLSFPLPGTGRAIAAGYFNDDGVPDLAAITNETGRSILSILVGSSSEASFAFPGGIAAGEFEPRSAVGLQDAGFVSDGSSSHLVAVDRNNEEVVIFDFEPDNFTLESPAEPARRLQGVGKRPDSLEVADFDIDGRDDMALATEVGVTFLWGTGSGEFTVEARALEEFVHLYDGPHRDKLSGMLVQAKKDPPELEIDVRELRAGPLNPGPTPDLLVPLRSRPDGPDPVQRDFLLVLLDPLPSPPGEAPRFGSVLVIETRNDPRIAVVANINGDSARDIVVACGKQVIRQETGEKTVFEAQVLFGDPANPGTVFESDSDCLPPLILSVNEDVGQFEFVATDQDPVFRKPFGFLLPDSATAGWIVSSHEREVFLFPIEGLEPSSCGGALRPVFGKPCSLSDATVRPETLLVEDLTGDGASDIAVCDEAGGAVRLFPRARANVTVCDSRAWDRPVTIPTTSPQRVVPISSGTALFLAIADRGQQGVSVHKFDPERTGFDSIGSASLDRQKASGSRLGFSVAPDAAQVALAVEDALPDERRDLDMVTFGENVDLAPLDTQGDLHALALLQVGGVSELDLLACEGDRIVRYRDVANCEGTLQPCQPEELLRLEEDLVDWSIAPTSAGTTMLAVATQKSIRLRDIENENMTETSIEPPGEMPLRRVALGRWGEHLYVAWIDGTHLRVWTENEESMVGEGQEMAALATRDVNGDGLDDIALAEAGRIRVFLAESKRGSLAFRPRFDLETEFLPVIDVSFLHADMDGAMDVCLGAADGTILVFRGNGYGDFGASSTLYAGPGLEGLRAMNLDGDVMDELLAATSIPGLVVLEIEEIIDR